MGWFLGCFKCRQRRPASSSINLSTNFKDQIGASASAGLLSTGNQLNDVKSNLHTERFELERFLRVQGNELEKNSSAISKTDRRCRSARKHSSEQSLQVEKLEEEINSLNRKLVEEASKATNLSNEVRHLRNCSALLDSPNAFKKALDALETASEEGQLEESQPLLYLQALLSKIESSEAVVEPSLEKRDETGASECSKNLLEECSNLSSMTEKEQNSLEIPHGKALVIEHDQLQQLRSISNAVTLSRMFDVEPGCLQKDDQNVCNSRRQCSFDEVNIDATQPQLISVIKRRSSTTLSFSGFLLMEEATEGRTISEQVAIEHFSSTEFSITNIIEKPDRSSENLVDSSKCLFAFATDSSQSRSISTDSSLFENVSKEFSSPSSESEAESSSERPDSNDSIFNLHYRSPRCLWSPQDDNTSKLHRECSSLSMEQSHVDTSYDGFSGALSQTSTSSSSKMDHISARSLGIEESDLQHDTPASSSKVLLQMPIPSVEDKGSTKRSANSHAPVRALRASRQEDISDVVKRNSCSSDCYSLNEVQENISDVLTRNSGSSDCYSLSESWPRSMDSSVSSCQQNPVYADSLEAGIEQAVASDAKHGRKCSISECQMSIRSLERSKQEEAIRSDKLSTSNEAALNLAGNFNKSTTNKEVTPQHISHLTSLRLVQDEISMVGGEASVELSTPAATSDWSSHTEVSPSTVHTFSPLPHADGIRTRITSDGLSQTPLTPISVNSILPLSNDGTNKPQCTPLRTPLASLSQVETPNCVHCQGPLASLGEDRPILGTVAAHWSHSSSSKQKWWDGKGIPNSTNKYKEDQKVSWHATPFEVRLERALDKQGRVFQKKLFTGAVASEMEVSI